MYKLQTNQKLKGKNEKEKLEMYKTRSKYKKGLNGMKEEKNGSKFTVMFLLGWSGKIVFDSVTRIFQGILHWILANSFIGAHPYLLFVRRYHRFNVLQLFWIDLVNFFCKFYATNHAT